MTISSSVLILGANGRLGSACVQAFANAGGQVTAQSRKAAAGKHPAGVTALVTGDDVLEDWMAKLPKIDVVVHAMSPVYTNAAWTAQVPALMAASIALAQQLGATLLFPGNVYNFGSGMPALLHESTPQQPTTVKGRLRVDIELALRQATEMSGLQAVVIRAGDFFGGGSGSMFDQVTVSKIKKGIVTHSGPLDVATPWAYLPDLAQTFVAVANKRQQLAKFEALQFAGHTISGRDWLRVLQPIATANGWVGDGQLLKTSALPWPVMRLMALLNPLLASLAEMRYLQSTPHALSNTRLLKLLGSEPHTPLAQAATSALAELGFLA